MKKFSILLALFLFSCTTTNPIYGQLNDDVIVVSGYEKSNTPEVIFYAGTSLSTLIVDLFRKDYRMITVSNNFAAKDRNEAEKFALEVNKKYHAAIIVIVDETLMAEKFEQRDVGDLKYSVGFFAKKKS